MVGRKLKKTEIERFFVKKNRNVKLVVILSCHSQTIGEIFSKCGISHVICVDRNEPILDKACLIFTKALYTALFGEANMTIWKAYENAKHVLANFNNDNNLTKEAEKFRLYHENSVESAHSVEGCSINIQTMQGEPLNDTHQPAICELPERDHCFVGREEEIISIFKKLKRNHLWLTGEHGIGKSSLVKKLTHMVYERNIYPDGVLYLCLQNCQDFYRLVELLFLTVFNSLTNNEEKFKLGSSRNTKTEQKYRACINSIKELKLLLILDDCDSYMSKPSNNFELFLQDLRGKLSESSIIITSREIINNEAMMNIEKVAITQLDSANILKILHYKIGGKHASILKEIQKLWEDAGINIQKKNSLKKIVPTEFFEHKLFDMINGNPLCAILVASLAKGKSNLITNRMISQ